MPETSFSNELPLPFRYLRDVTHIEECVFGKWRIFALSFWSLTALLFLAGSQIFLMMHQMGIDGFIHVDVQVLSNVNIDTPHRTWNIPIIQPGSYGCFLVFIIALIMTLKALFIRTERRQHVLPTATEENLNI